MAIKAECHLKKYVRELRESAEKQVENSQALIERLRSQLAQTDKTEEIDKAVDEQLSRIKTAEAEIDVLTGKKYALEAEYRKLEAEVGPIKYVAELIYGETAQDNFDKSVRFVILILIFVFDPLAVLLLIAANISLRQWRKKRNLIKSEEKFNLAEQLDRERSKLKKVREKTRDYRKMMTKIGDFKDMSPDEIKVKLDQIYDWNDKTIK